MALTAAQLERRKLGIGASDAATICGVNPYETAYDLWLKLTGKVVVPSIDDLEAVEIGNALEPAIGALAERRLNRKVVRPTSPFVLGIQRANVDFMLDRFAKGSDILEAKSTGTEEDWGEPMTNQVPERFLIQVTQQMACAESGKAYVARLCGHFRLKFDLYVVEFNPRLAMRIQELVQEFWGFVQNDTPPSGLPSLDVVRLIRPTPGKHISIAPTLGAAFDAARAASKAAAKTEDAAKAAMLAAMGDAETALSGDFVIHKKVISREAYAVEASTYSQVTVKAAKVAKGK